VDRWTLILVVALNLVVVFFSPFSSQVSNEGDKFEVTAEVARMAVMASNLLEGTDDETKLESHYRTGGQPAANHGLL
jgi:hypothetical protein